MIHSSTIVPDTGCLCKTSLCDGMSSPLSLPLLQLRCTSSKKRQAWRTLSVKAAGLNMQSVMRQSITSSFAFRLGRETRGSLTPNVICENLAIMAHDKPRSRRQFIRDSGIATGLAAVSLACGARAQTKRQVTVRLDWIYQGPNAGFIVAQEKGFYEQAGLNVEIGPGKGSGSTAQLVASKATQFGFADGYVVGNAVSKGMNIRAVAGLYRRNPTAVVVLADSDIKTPKDLEGKTIAIAAGPSRAAGSTAARFASPISIQQAVHPR